MRSEIKDVKISVASFKSIYSSLTLSLPANCITDAVSSLDQSPKKAEQTKLSVWGTVYGVRIRKNLKESVRKSHDVL